MSIQWTFIAGYLYFEIAIVTLMTLPIINAKKWCSIYRSRIFEFIYEKATIYFYGWLSILCLFLFDSIREMRKYSHSSDPVHVHLANEMKGSVKLFRAQRNFYITGFAIFLAFVIRRLVLMTINQYELEVKAQMVIDTAESAVRVAKSTVLLSQQNYDEDARNKLEVAEFLLEAHKLQVKELKKEVTMWKQKYEEIKNKSSDQGDN